MNSTFDYHRLFKWIALLSLLCVIIAIIYSTFLYLDIEKSKVKGMDSSEKRVYQETDILIIDKIEPFYGEESYHIVTGKDENKQAFIAFVPLTSVKEKIKVVNQADIISKDTIYNDWNKNCSKCKMIKMTPGIIEDEMIWEITYRDALNRYVLEYLFIYDGKQYERLRFTERFK